MGGTYAGVTVAIIGTGLAQTAATGLTTWIYSPIVSRAGLVFSDVLFDVRGRKIGVSGIRHGRADIFRAYESRHAGTVGKTEFAWLTEIGLIGGAAQKHKDK